MNPESQNTCPEFRLFDAVKLAVKAHAAQVDKIGQPYIYHPLAVMSMLETEEEMIVGVLHDVVEDTPVTLDDLRRAGASDEIIAAVDSISKRQDEPLEVYWDRVRANPLARRVKLMDARHNSDPFRLAQFESREKQERFRLKYEEIIRIMAESISHAG